MLEYRAAIQSGLHGQKEERAKGNSLNSTRTNIKSSICDGLTSCNVLGVTDWLRFQQTSGKT